MDGFEHLAELRAPWRRYNRMHRSAPRLWGRTYTATRQMVVRPGERRPRWSGGRWVTYVRCVVGACAGTVWAGLDRL